MRKSPFAMRTNSFHMESIEDKIEHIKVLQEYLNKIECDEFESEENETVEETAKFILSSIFVTSDENIMLLLREVCYMMTIRPKLVKSYVELVRRFYRTKDYERIHKIYRLLITKLNPKDSIFLGAVCLLKELLFQNIISIDQVMDICLQIRSEQVHALIYFSCVEKIKTINLKTLDTITAHLENDHSSGWFNMRKLLKESKSIESLYIYASEVYPSQTPAYFIKIDALDGLIELFSSNPDSFSVNGIVESNMYETCELANKATYLQFSLLYNSPECANWLICNGAKVNNCLKYAVAGGNIKLVNSIDQNTDEDEVDSKEQSIEIALQFRRDDVFKWLMEHVEGFDERMIIYAFHTNNFTAIAEITNNENFIEYLKKNKIELLKDSISREEKHIVTIILYFGQGIHQEEINALKPVLDSHKEYRAILQRSLPLIGQRFSR